MTNAEVRAVGLVLWLIIGIIVAHRCRRSSIGIQFLLLILVSKGFIVYWIVWGLPSRLIRFGWHFYRDRVEWGELRKIGTAESGDFFTYFREQQRIRKEERNSPG